MSIQSVMPKLGFGTYGRTGEAGIAAILAALEIGYRHLDTAQTYDTEREVGEAVRRSGLNRGELFVTTKVTSANYRPGMLVDSLRRSLDQLGMEAVDLALLHWPSPTGEQPLAEYLPQLVEAQALGLARYIGVSNFTIALLEEAKGLVGAGKIVNNQIELNPHMQNKKLASYCSENDILVTCYQPIAKGRLAGDIVLERIAAAHAATVEQVAIAFELAKGYAAIPTSGQRERIISNFDAQRVALDADEIAAIETIDRNARAVDPVWGPDWD